MTNLPGSPSAFPSGGSKVIRGIITRKEGQPGNEARIHVHVVFFTDNDNMCINEGSSETY